MNKNKPWYTEYALWKTKANDYLNAYKKSLLNFQLYEQQNIQVSAFVQSSLIKLIFESNTIEGSGTKTYGETERIFEKIKKKYQLNTTNFTFETKEEFFSVFSHEDSRDIAVVKHDKSFKEYKMVMQHWKTFIVAMIQYTDFRERNLNEPLFNTNFIKKLHKSISEGFLEEGQIAGEYRDFDDITIVGQDLTFPAHRLLPQAMEAFVERANKLIEKGLNDKEADIFLIMAQITYEFVRIHPFPDFNGRLSRILLQMITHTFGIRFCVVIKGNKKGRERYMAALKRANAIKDYENPDYKHLEAYATLIAMSVVESFEEIDNNLKLAGLKTIL